MGKSNIKKTKIKKVVNNNKRNYFNCTCYYNNCPFNTCWCFNSNANRRKWNTNSGTKSKNRN